jgi:hypothetical protein
MLVQALKADDHQEWQQVQGQALALQGLLLCGRGQFDQA